jgi:hypothetical protein
VDKIVTNPQKHRDLSELSALLAAHTTPVTDQPAKPAKAKLPTPANDNKPAPDVLAWPTFERLAYRRDESRLYALRHWKNMCFPGSELEPAKEDDMNEEAGIEIRPSEGELLGAIGWKVVGTERWSFTKEVVNVYQPQDCTETHHVNNDDGVDTRLGNLLFRDGALVEWGRTAKGKPLRPVERPRGVKGGTSAARSGSRIWSYIDLKGAVASPLTATPYTTPISGKPAISDFYSPLPREEPSAKDKHGRFGVKEARELLRNFGVDGSVPFDKLPVAATKYDRGLVAGPQWVGGIKKPKPAGEISVAAGKEPEFVRQVEVKTYLDHLRERLGKHATVLDLAITDASAKQIGIAMGQSATYAEKRGSSVIDAALDALIAIDETAIGRFSQEKEKLAA